MKQRRLVRLALLVYAFVLVYFMFFGFGRLEKYSSFQYSLKIYSIRLEDLDFQRGQSGSLYAAWRADSRQPFAGVAKVFEMPAPLFVGNHGAGIIANAEPARQF